MKVEFLKTFSKDIDDIKVQSVKRNLLQLIEFIELTHNLDSIPNTKKLKGHRNAYRIRIGDYRLGFFVSNSTIV
ncbi:MAG: type II toxin-antitoxin system RelE family toxin, partial [Flavitalea sp.]